METISIRFENEFLHDIKKVMKTHRYVTKAEFIREAIRDKIKDLEKEKALMRLEKAYGASKRRTTQTELEKAKKKAFEDMAKQLK